MLTEALVTLEALSSMGVEIEASGDHLRFRPQSAMTPDLLEAVKSSKAELLEILRESPQSRSYADQEFDRFEQVAVATESGGWRNPETCSAELAEQIRTGGIPFEAVNKSETDYARTSKEAKHV